MRRDRRVSARLKQPSRACPPACPSGNRRAGRSRPPSRTRAWTTPLRAAASRCKPRRPPGRHRRRECTRRPLATSPRTSAERTAARGGRRAAGRLRAGSCRPRTRGRALGSTSRLRGDPRRRASGVRRSARVHGRADGRPTPAACRTRRLACDRLATTDRPGGPRSPWPASVRGSRRSTPPDGRCASRPRRGPPRAGQDHHRARASRGGRNPEWRPHPAPAVEPGSTTAEIEGCPARRPRPREAARAQGRDLRHREAKGSSPWQQGELRAWPAWEPASCRRGAAGP